MRESEGRTVRVTTGLASGKRGMQSFVDEDVRVSPQPC